MNLSRPMLQGKTLRLRKKESQQRTWSIRQINSYQQDRGWKQRGGEEGDSEMDCSIQKRVLASFFLVSFNSGTSNFSTFSFPFQSFPLEASGFSFFTNYLSIISHRSCEWKMVLFFKLQQSQFSSSKTSCEACAQIHLLVMVIFPFSTSLIPF